MPPLIQNRRSFTYVEIIVVIVIFGLLAAVALPQFANTKERTMDKEAKVNLQVIQEAETTYKMENENYFPYPAATTSTITGENGINAKLKIGLPATQENPPPNQANWTYSIDTTVAGSEKATATRVGAGGRIWTILFPPTSSDIPTCTGTGCP